MSQLKKILAAPKGDGFSKRIIGLMIAVLAIVMGLFLHFTMHSIKTPRNAHSKTKSPITTAADHDDAEKAIDAIAAERHPRVLVKYRGAVSGRDPSLAERYDSNSDNQRGLASNIDTTTLSAEDQKAAGNAALSVFNAPPENSSDYEENGMTHYRRSNVGDNHSTIEHTRRLSGSNGESNQNDQQQKIAFMNAARQAKHYLGGRLDKPLSAKEIKAGTIIPATLVTGINSDLPGTMIAKVRKSVFDTATGNHLLIPQGTTLIGLYDSQVAYGQSRVLVAWQRLIYPDGQSYDLEGMPGADLSGMAGLSDKVNNHYGKIFGSALMFSLFGSAAQLSQPQNNSNQLTSQQIIAASLGQQVTQTGMQLVAKNMGIQPTIEIRPGTNFNVLLTRDMLF